MCVSLLVVTVIAKLSDALTAALRRAAPGPVWDAAVLLGGCGGHRPAAGAAAQTPAQVCVCVFVCVLPADANLHFVPLIYSSNRLRLPAEPSSLSRAFGRLTVLAINDCDLTWPQVRSTSVVFLLVCFCFGFYQDVKANESSFLIRLFIG